MTTNMNITVSDPNEIPEPRVPRRRRAIAAALVAVLAAGSLSGCVTDGAGNKEVMGSLLGAGLGGWAGSKVGGGKGQLAATAAGVVLGGLLGNSIGTSLDRADMAYASKAQNAAYNAPVGQTITWSNPESGHRGEITPTREGIQNGTGAYCREYQTEISVGGQTQSGYGTACRMPDGAWKVQS